MNILSIGNSFSQDAHKWLHKLGVVNGRSIETVNLYIGGCSLERHYNNLMEDKADYDLEYNGGGGVRKISIAEALKMRKFDVITLQQCSPKSGMPQSYIPYITVLADAVRQAQPQAQLWFHQTWRTKRIMTV